MTKARFDRTKSDALRLLRAGRLVDAAVAVRAALVVADEGEVGDVDVALAYEALARIQAQQGDAEGAAASARRVVGLLAGADDLRLAAARVALANHLVVVGDLDGACVQLEVALAAYEATLGADHYETALVRGKRDMVKARAVAAAEPQ